MNPNHKRIGTPATFGVLLAITSFPLSAAEPITAIRDANITGGIVVQIGSGDLALRELGERFHVRLLLPDAAEVNKAQMAVDQAGLQGRFTVSMWDAKSLPFAERVINALVTTQEDQVPEAEAFRALAPRGLLISPAGVRSVPVPATIDEWTHYLHSASGNPVSKDQEVATPRSFRWYAPPFHLRSHNWGASFLGLVTGGGRIFHLLDEGSFFMEEGGLAESWSLVARDAFNGALLWKLPLKDYGQTFFEDVGRQPTDNNIWRSPLSINRRAVVQGDKLYAALAYRDGPLSILDAATGQALHQTDLGGSVDEIIAEGDLVICRVRSEIPMPSNAFSLSFGERKKLAEQLGSADKAKEALTGRFLKHLMEQKLERVVAVDAASGKILWEHDGPVVANQSLAMKDGVVVYHNYQALVALDSNNGEVKWEFANPATNAGLFDSNTRGMLGSLILAEGKVLWASATCGGGYVLELTTGSQLWHQPGLREPGGFGFPTALRIVAGTIWYDTLRGHGLADGKTIKGPDLGGMLKRGHHVRCFPGKATERFLILPMRGAEFVDLHGEDHMVNDWIRGTCSMGNLPANGLFYTTPDPCSCYSGSKINGFNALAHGLPPNLDQAPPPDSDSRLEPGPAYSAANAARFPATLSTDPADWPAYRSDAARTARAHGPLGAPAGYKPLWTFQSGGFLTPPVIAGEHLFVVNKATYELLCLEAGTGEVLWKRGFPGALDGPPTAVAGFLFLGGRDGYVYCLRASDGELAWRFLAAPLHRLTLSEDRLESVWPVSSSLVYHQGTIYAPAGRNSFLDKGLHIYALDPATGKARHHLQLDGPWPTREQLRTPVLSDKAAEVADPTVREQLANQLASGYDLEGADADLLVSDGEFLYMRQNKFTSDLKQVTLQRTNHIGVRPMGGQHVMAQFGFLDDSHYHRTYWLYDDHWSGKAGGGGSAAKAGSILAVGADRVYAAQHYVGGWYPKHDPGVGNRLIADSITTQNKLGSETDPALRKELNVSPSSSDYVRQASPLWETATPVIIRSVITAPDGNSGEAVLCAGVVEGTTKAEWDLSGKWDGPAKLQIFDGASGQLLAEHDLPACPVFDGMATAGGRIFLSLRSGDLLCLSN